MKKIIIALSLMLIILVTTYVLITKLLMKKQNNQEETIKQEMQTQIKITNEPNISPKAKPTLTTEQILKNVKVLSIDEANIVQQAKNKLPLNTPDIDISYSYVFEKFIISKKTPQAQTAINQWLKNNQLEQIYNDFPILFITTDQPAEEYKNNMEEKYQIQNNLITSPKPTTISYVPIATSLSNVNSEVSTTDTNVQNDSNMFVDILKTLFSFKIAPSQTPTSIVNQKQDVTPASNPTYVPPNTNTVSSLSDIFNEVHDKVGVPVKILEAIVKIECSSTYNLSSDEINSYSQPGNGIPFCQINLCSAAGSTQMTVGIDDQGDTTCPRCGAGFCPNQWSVYGNAVNTYGGYSHQSYIMNIRDNIYSAAAKLKNDIGATDKDNWTYDQVVRSSERYYGSCADKYRYNHLGGRTYCECVWDYYTKGECF